MDPEADRLSLWRFMYGSRPKDDELAYRNHYLANDMRQIKVMSYAAMGFMVALTVQDLFDLAENPSLMIGIVLRFALIIIGVVGMETMHSGQSPRSVDIRVIIFSSIVAAGLVAVHYIPGISPVRMVGVGTLFIIAVHIGFPSYAAILMPSIAIVIGGEISLLFSPSRPYLEEFRLLIPIVLAFAEYMAILGSAHYHRTRYQAYKAISEVKTLSGMLPICSSCKKIRDDQGYYQQIESFLLDHSEVEFSHSICPECISKLNAESG